MYGNIKSTGAMWCMSAISVPIILSMYQTYYNIK